MTFYSIPAVPFAKRTVLSTRPWRNDPRGIIPPLLRCWSASGTANDHLALCLCSTSSMVRPAGIGRLISARQSHWRGVIVPRNCLWSTVSPAHPAQVQDCKTVVPVKTFNIFCHHREYRRAQGKLLPPCGGFSLYSKRLVVVRSFSRFIKGRFGCGLALISEAGQKHFILSSQLFTTSSAGESRCR